LKTWMHAFEQEPGPTESVENFISKDYQYFFEDSFFENELNELNSVMSKSWIAVCDLMAKKFLRITEQQARLTKTF